MSFTIAIVGRPNVGKSTLFNRLAGGKKALTSDIPGLTRDRKSEQATLGDINMTIIDTAGLEKAETDTLEKLMMEQTERAMDDADIIMFVIDGVEGIVPADQHLAKIIRRKNKPVILIANKCESKRSEAGVQEAYSLGFGDPVEISAEHNIGMEKIYDTLLEVKNENAIPDEEYIEEEKGVLQIAIAGRPNVGKSTFFNKLVGEARSIASPVPGTTRDAIYVDWEFEGTKIKLVDTAGLRKKARQGEVAEKLSVDDTYKAMQFSNLVILLIDAEAGVDKQDLAIADHIMNEGRGIIIALNKWDAVKDKKRTLEDISHRLEYSLYQARGVPLITISAITGENINKLVKKALKVFEQWNERISTGKLNRWIAKAIEANPPPMSKGKRIKLRYITQVKSRPPTFALFTTSNLKEFPDSYLRYMTNSMRDEFGFGGVPIRILVRKQKNPFDKK